MTRFNTQISVTFLGISFLNFVMHHPAQFSLNSICASKSIISLGMKCPQLSKPEATAARNRNSIGDKMEKKALGETRLSRGASTRLARQTSSLFQLQQSQIVRANWFQWSFPDGCLDDGVLIGICLVLI